MSELTLPSSQRGFASQYFWSLVWAIGLYYISNWGFNLLAELTAEVSGRRWLSQSAEMKMFGFYMMAYVPLGIIAIMAIVNLWTMLYSAHETNVFFKKDGYWQKVRSIQYGFPYSVTQSEQVFDRITKITVEQSTLDKLFNTGTIKLTFATFTNADAQETEWTIPALKQPYDQKARIEEALRGHEGLQVKLSR